MGGSLINFCNPPLYSYDIVSGAHGNGYWTKLTKTLSMQCGNANCWPVDAVVVGDLCQITTTTSTTAHTTTTTPYTPGPTESTSVIITSKPPHPTTTSTSTTSETTSGKETTDNN